MNINLFSSHNYIVRYLLLWTPFFTCENRCKKSCPNNRKAKLDPRSMAGLISIFMFCLFLSGLDGLKEKKKRDPSSVTEWWIQELWSRISSESVSLNIGIKSERCTVCIHLRPVSSGELSTTGIFWKRNPLAL